MATIMRHHMVPQSVNIPDPYTTLRGSKSSTSLLSSLHPSAAPATPAPLSKPNMSGLISPDQLPPRLRLTSPTPRSSSLAHIMGQPHSRLASPASATPTSASAELPLPPLPPSDSPKATTKGAGSFSAGYHFKRVFGGRKKQSDDVPSALTLSSQLSSVEEPETPTHASFAPPPLSASSLNPQEPEGKADDAPSSLPPPPPPPKSPLLIARFERENQLILHPEPQSRQRAAPPTPSSITSAAEDMRSNDVQRDQPRAPLAFAQEKVLERQGAEQKEGWRKSDSTISHHTIRAASGARSSRPVSMAESFHSSHTIVSPRRLSALVTDVEFAMAEEEGVLDELIVIPTKNPPSQQTSPPSSLRSKHRHSVSLNVSGSLSSTGPASSASEKDVSVRPPALSPKNVLDSPQISTPKDTPTLTRSAAGGVIVATSIQDPKDNVRGRLAAWTATTQNTVSPTSTSCPMPPPSPRSRLQSTSISGLGFRQTAISITGSFAPAAGLARRAVERMGRALTGRGLISSQSGHLSSPSQDAISHLDPHSDDSFFGTETKPSADASSNAKCKVRRTPNASSTGSFGSQSSSTFPESDSSSTTTGPTLGKCLRWPIRPTGLVFGKNLRSCAWETAAVRQRSALSTKPEIRDLELRKLPALVVRSAQHILLWGVQEEGLFRVPGRSAHVVKLRSAFDSGADYDMSECSPGDIDPHAVASVFKAYLRELPEPILTTSLMPLFEAAVSKECQPEHINSSRPQKGQFGSSLPTRPRLPPKDTLPAIRKPPSLSTLALPKLSTMRASEELLAALASLLARLPQEHRELMCTVAELIRATAKRSQETKMPLSNLLLVFCPSLQMSPQLLRVLCESESLWKRAEDAQSAGTQPATPAEPNPKNAPIAADDKSMPGEEDLQEKHVLPKRPFARPREPVATLYLDAEDLLPPDIPDIPAPKQAQQSLSTSPASRSADNKSLEDDDSFLSLPGMQSAASPASRSCFTCTDNTSISSSADSLPTPLTSPQNNSFVDLSISQKDNAVNQSPSLSILAMAEPGSLLLPPESRPTMHTVRAPEVPEAPPPPTTRSIFASSSISRRISIPALRIPDPSPNSAGPVSGQSFRSKRKKPSLNFFSKRSPASASPSLDSPVVPWSPYLQNRTRSETSTSTPISALETVTAPESMVSILPPTLDLDIGSSGLGLAVEGGETEESAAKDLRVLKSGSKAAASTLSLSMSAMKTPTTNQFDVSASTPTPGAPPIRPNPVHMRHHANPSTASFASSYHRLSFEDREEDWTQSVLEAAVHAEGYRDAVRSP